jgi:hypothetical protein
LISQSRGLGDVYKRQARRNSLMQGFKISIFKIRTNSDG